jgi:predicted Zn-dependent peptidase
VPLAKHTAWLLPCLALACRTEVTRTMPRPPAAPVIESVQAGVRLATLVRPTPGWLRLSLYIDAGSRDASPPEAATVAAWLAAEQAGSTVEALVYPDVTELARTCESANLEACLAELARALSFRAPTPDQLSRAQARLVDVRRRALAADPIRPVDELAAHALLGDAAQGFFPLGRAQDDPQLTAASVEQLLREHYGPTRALLVAAGDVEPEKFNSAAAQLFAKLPAAAAPRAARSFDLPDTPALETAVDERAALGFALIGAEESDVRARALLLAERVSSELTVTGHVFQVRGAALALLRVDAGAGAALGPVTRELVLLREEEPPPMAAGSEGDDLASISRDIGLRFGTGETTTSSAPGTQFGAGLLLEGAAGAGPRGKAQLERSEADRRAQAQQLFQRALAIAEPRTRGEVDEYAAAVVTDNGARIDVQFAHSPYAAIAVRVAPGAEQDPTELHGRSALLASLTASACAGLSPERLRDQLAQLGATLEPRVNAESYGLLLRAPRENWQPALDLALRCARQPSRSASDFAAAAARLQERYIEAAPEPSLRARLAMQIAPRAPGMCAPWGDAGRIGNLSPRLLAAAFHDSEVGARWSVALVGPVPIADATGRIARRLADLPAGTLPGVPQPGEPERTPFVVAADVADGATLLATWSARGQFVDRLGALVFASALHAWLAQLPGVEVLWQDADTYPAGAYAALELRATAEVLPRLPAALAESAGRLEQAALDEALERALPLAERTRSSADVEASVRAERLARTRLGANLAPATRESAQALLSALRKTTPRVSFLR